MKKFLIELLLKLLSKITFKNTIALESRSDFCDSTKSLYEYLIQNGYNNKYKIYWLVQNPKAFKDIKVKNVKFLNRKKIDFKAIFIRFCAEYCIYTHDFIGNKYNKKQKRIFTTHAAMPIKNSSGMFPNIKYLTHILGTSEMCVHYRNICLDGDLNQYQITGLPRNDELFIKDKTILNRLNIKNKFIIWMPTFKHHASGKRNDFKSQKINKDVSLLTKDNIDKLNKSLKQSNITLIIKPHPSQDLSFMQVQTTENILFVTNQELTAKNISLYQLMALSDGLITDFSSVYLDYLLVNKPIAFDLTDQAKYKKGIGYIMDTPEDFMPGVKIKSIKDMLQFITTIKDKTDNYKNERKLLCNKVHKFKDNNSSKRLVELMGLKL